LENPGPWIKKRRTLSRSDHEKRPNLSGGRSAPIIPQKGARQISKKKNWQTGIKVASCVKPHKATRSTKRPQKKVEDSKEKIPTLGGRGSKKGFAKPSGTRVEGWGEGKKGGRADACTKRPRTKTAE